MTKFKNFHLLILFFLILSCENENNKRNKDALFYTDQDFERSSLISEKIDSITEHLIFSGPMLIVKDKLVILDRKSERPMHIVDLKTEKHLGVYGKVGQGPGEISAAWSLSNVDENSFLVMDFAQRKIVEYNIDTLLAKNDYVLEQKISQNEYVTFASLYNEIIFYVVDNNLQNRLYGMEFNNPNSKVLGYGETPVLINKSESDNVKSAAAAVKMKSSNGFFVLSYKLSPRIDIFNYKKNNWKTIIAPKDFEIKYKSMSEEGESFFAVTKETLNAYIDVALTENYIYALFSEDKLLETTYLQGKHVYVFDYEGKPIKKLVLDRYISYLSVKNDSILYGTSIDVVPELLKFNLINKN